MNLAAKKINVYPAIIGLKIGKDTITATMSDGREVSVPMAWFPNLSIAKKTELKHFEISPGGYGIHWPDIDEDISVKAFVDGLDH